MANADALYETLDTVLANLHAWNQENYIRGRYHFGSIGECGTTQCIAGFRCLMDGLLPVREHGCLDDDVDGIIFVDPATGVEWSAELYARDRFGLNHSETEALFEFYTSDPAELKQRVDEIVAGEWRRVVDDEHR